MAYSTAKCFGSHQSIASELQTLLNGLSIQTIHDIVLSQIGSDYFIAIVVYTASA